MLNLNYKLQFNNSQCADGMQKWLDSVNDRPLEDIDPTDWEVTLKEDEYAICMADGSVITKSEGKLVCLGKDLNWLDQFKKTQGGSRYKENTAFKIIERTAKAEVWGRAAFYLEQNVAKDLPENPSVQHLLKFFKSKAESHREYLDGQRVMYDYATQNFLPLVKETEAN